MKYKTNIFYFVILDSTFVKIIFVSTENIHISSKTHDTWFGLFMILLFLCILHQNVFVLCNKLLLDNKRLMIRALKYLGVSF